jgi:GNAT superfamily N-acetyltransferase
MDGKESHPPDVSPFMDRDHQASDVLGGGGARSSESRLRRFLSPKSSLSDREVAFLTDVGRGERAAMTAVDGRDGSVLGIARYTEGHRCRGVADTAVAVADEVQRRGIGTALMLRLIIELALELGPLTRRASGPMAS